jgi:hypothetical protein
MMHRVDMTAAETRDLAEALIHNASSLTSASERVCVEIGPRALSVFISDGSVRWRERTIWLAGNELDSPAPS